jgi:hypothetical protein
LREGRVWRMISRRSTDREEEEEQLPGLDWARPDVEELRMVT